jgi:hypothetical protein
MSMPQIDLEALDPKQALVNVIASIALEEAALSHIINAEGEKIQAAVAIDDVTVAQLESVNASVGKLTGHVVSIEDALHNKLHTVIDTLHPPVPQVTADVTLGIVDQDEDEATANIADFLLTGTTANNEPYNQTATAEDGEVTFPGVPEGDYLLTQPAPDPSGVYITMDPTPIHVVVMHDGTFEATPDVIVTPLK